MTIDSNETSVFGGAPVELYTFDRVGITFWRYTSADEDQTYSGQIYEAVPMKSGEIEQSQDVVRNTITITMPISTDFVQQFIQSPPTDIFNFTLRRIHADDIDGDVVALYIGKVTNIDFKENIAEITIEPVLSSFGRPTLRRLYQAGCPHVLYGAQCAASSSTFRVEGVITTVSGVDISANEFSSYADQYFAGGFVELLVSGVYNKRFITSHVGSTLTLNLPLTGAVTGLTLRAYPGCRHNVTDCHDKFNNIVNYGGQPFIPSKNPMGGIPIF